MPKGLFFRSANNYDMDAVSVETGLTCVGPGRTKQEFKDESDINVILRRFNITGQLPENVRMPTYADFTGVDDFHSAANAIANANEAFDAMPAEVRRRFANDPADFVAFCSDQKNLAEARKLGLVPAAERVDPAREPARSAAPASEVNAEAAPSGGTAPSSAVV